MRPSLLIAVVIALATAFAVAGEPAVCAPASPSPSPAMMVPIQNVVRFVNTGLAIVPGTYARDAVVTDEFAPFVWTSINAGASWSQRFTASNAATNITRPHIVLSAPTEFNVSSPRAYIVFPGLFTPLLNGKPYTETGYWTFVLVKDGAAWRIASQAWAGVSFH